MSGSQPGEGGGGREAVKEKPLPGGAAGALRPEYDALQKFYAV